MKRRLTILALTVLAVVALTSVVLTVTSPAHAGAPPPHARGATQISGVGLPAGVVECTDADAPEAPEGTDPTIPPPAPLKFTGDLNGCFYSFPSKAADSPSGTYRERGIDIFVGDLYIDGAYIGTGTFAMNYLFTAKFDEEGEIWGRCQHPIIADSGTGVFDGVTGRLDLKDDVETGEFFYRGHLKGL